MKTTIRYYNIPTRIDKIEDRQYQVLARMWSKNNTFAGGGGNQHSCRQLSVSSKIKHV